LIYIKKTKMYLCMRARTGLITMVDQWSTVLDAMLELTPCANFL